VLDAVAAEAVTVYIQDQKRLWL